MEEAVSEEYKQELREEMLAYKKRKDEEVSKQLQSVEASVRKSISQDYENQLRLLRENSKENEEKLRQARQRELEFLQREQAIKTREEELELQVQRRLLEERSILGEKIRKEELDKVALRETDYQLRLKEMEKQLEDQKKLAEEMRRKAEQGSMQLQGEVQELALEEMLRSTFPFDKVEEVGKGVRGADCILTVRNTLGQECGRIVYESKRTKEFAKDWIEKLKADMRHLGADIAVLVTQAMPRDMDRFGEKDGIWICSFAEVRALSQVLRDGILKIFLAGRTQENKGEKMTLLYDYLTGNEFAEQWKAIREGFLSMKLSIQRERDAMERLWKAREKQLEKVLLNAAHIKGSVEGIAGTDSVDLRLSGEDDEALLLEG